MFNYDCLTDLSHNIKHTNTHIIGVSEGEEREKRVENLFDEIMAENILNLKKETDIQFQEAQRIPYKMNPHQNITKWQKLKREF